MRLGRRGHGEGPGSSGASGHEERHAVVHRGARTEDEGGDAAHLGARGIIRERSPAWAGGDH